ncbi:MAG: hypothetical protein IMZ74_17955 [Actinobacteria bacterium]|nr:hypothetical protein [Actinomycetota bacterium]
MKELANDKTADLSEMTGTQDDLPIAWRPSLEYVEPSRTRVATCAPPPCARERALDILQHDEPEPLDDDARRELRRIVGDADRELRG